MPADPPRAKLEAAPAWDDGRGALDQGEPASSRVRGGRPDDLAASRGGCDQISLRRHPGETVHPSRPGSMCRMPCRHRRPLIRFTCRIRSCNKVSRDRCSRLRSSSSLAVRVDFRDLLSRPGRAANTHRNRRLACCASPAPRSGQPGCRSARGDDPRATLALARSGSVTGRRHGGGGRLTITTLRYFDRSK